MKKIALNQNKFTIVDDEDFEHLNQWRWFATKRGNSFYAERSQRVGKRKLGKSKGFKIHRLIMGITDPLVLCDHIDGDGLNNQKSNLRLCNRSQNNCNRRSSKNSSSKFKGVSYHRITKMWQSSMTKDKKSIYIGLFRTEVEAAIAYNKKAIELHGEFANLNCV